MQRSLAKASHGIAFRRLVYLRVTIFTFDRTTDENREYSEKCLVNDKAAKKRPEIKRENAARRKTL